MPEVKNSLSKRVGNLTEDKRYFVISLKGVETVVTAANGGPLKIINQPVK